MNAYATKSLVCALFTLCLAACAGEAGPEDTESVDETRAQLAPAGCHSNIDRCIQTAEQHEDSNPELYHNLVDACIDALCTFD